MTRSVVVIVYISDMMRHCPAFFRRLGWIIVVVGRLLPMAFPIHVDLRQQFIPVPPYCHRYFLLDFLVQIRAGFDVRPIYENLLRRQRLCRLCLVQNPLEYRFYRFSVNRCRKL